MSPPVIAGLVSVCSWNFSDSSRRPLRAADAERSRSSEEGGDGTMSSSRTMRRSRLSAGTLRRDRLAPSAPRLARRCLAVRSPCARPVSGRFRPFAGARFPAPSPLAPCERVAVSRAAFRRRPRRRLAAGLAAPTPCGCGSPATLCGCGLASPTRFDGGFPASRRPGGLAFGHRTILSTNLDSLPISDLSS